MAKKKDKPVAVRVQFDRSNHPLNKQPRVGTWSGSIPVTIRCPKCGHYTRIKKDAKTHTINAEGEVMPKVDCANMKCEYSEYIKLGDWNSTHHEFGGWDK